MSRALGTQSRVSGMLPGHNGTKPAHRDSTETNHRNAPQVPDLHMPRMPIVVSRFEL